MTQFLPARIFSVYVLALGYCENVFSIYVSLSIRRAGSQSVDTQVKSQRWVSNFWLSLKTLIFLLLLSLSLLFLLKSHAPQVHLPFCLFHFLNSWNFFLDFVWFICTLNKHISAQNAFMYKNMYTHKWVFVGTHEYTYMLRKIKDKERKFLGTMLCIFLFIIFWKV